MFDDSRYARSIYYATSDVDPRTGAFLMALTRNEEDEQGDVLVAVNWFAELRTRMGG